MTDLPTLIARVEALSGPDREVDGLVAQAFGEIPSDARWDDCWFSGHYGAYKFHDPAEYTASLDAVVALAERVLPGWRWGIMTAVGPWSRGGAFMATLDCPESSGFGMNARDAHTTPALALLLALLLKAASMNAPRLPESMCLTRKRADTGDVRMTDDRAALIADLRRICAEYDHAKESGWRFFGLQSVEPLRRAAAALAQDATPSAPDGDVFWLKAQLTARSKTIVKARETLINIRDELEDDGDRVFFGSTNDADQFRELVDDLDGWAWSDIIRDADGRDYIGELRDANIAKDAALARVAELEEAAEIGLNYIYSEFQVKEGECEDGSHIAPVARADWLKITAALSALRKAAGGEG